MPLQGVKLAEYVVLKEIGRGEFSIVSEAFSESGKKRYAIKRIKRKCDEDTCRSALDKLVRLPRFDKLVNVEDVLFHEDKPIVYVVMQYVPQYTLDSYMLRPNLDSKKKYTLIQEITTAVQKLHSLDIVHGDLRPANIFVDFQGDKVICRVADFGITSVQDRGPTPNEVTIVAYLFRAPENEKSVYADIFSLGAVYMAIIIQNFVRLYEREYLAPNIQVGNDVFPLHILAKQGTLNKHVEKYLKEFGALKGIIKAMLKFEPKERPHPAHLLVDVTRYKAALIFETLTLSDIEDLTLNMFFQAINYRNSQQAL